MVGGSAGSQACFLKFALVGLVFGAEHGTVCGSPGQHEASEPAGQADRGSCPGRGRGREPTLAVLELPRVLFDVSPETRGSVITPTLWSRSSDSSAHN